MIRFYKFMLDEIIIVVYPVALLLSPVHPQVLICGSAALISMYLIPF